MLPSVMLTLLLETLWKLYLHPVSLEPTNTDMQRAGLLRFVGPGELFSQTASILTCSQHLWAVVLMRRLAQRGMGTDDHQE